MALENKLGLTSSADLAREEERISKKRPCGCLRAARWTSCLSARSRRLRQFIKHFLRIFMTLRVNSAR